VSLASLTIYIGSHRAVTSNMQQKITIKEVCGARAWSRAFVLVETGEAFIHLPWLSCFFHPPAPLSHLYPPTSLSTNPTTQQPPPPPPQGLLAPIALSCSLFGLYLLLKYTDLDLSTFLTLYFWLLASLALTGAAAPLLKRVGDALRQPTWEVEAPEGLLLDEQGESVTRASLQPSAVLAGGVAVGVATWDALHHGMSSFTFNNMVSCGLAGWF